MKWSFVLQNQSGSFLSMHWKQKTMDLSVREHNHFGSKYHLPNFIRKSDAPKCLSTLFDQEPPKELSCYSVMKSGRNLSIFKNKIKASRLEI